MAASAALVLQGTAFAQAPIKIGLFAPLTGGVAANGINIRDGVALVVDQVNAQGGIHGRKIELLTEDDRNSPKDAATVAQKIVDSGDVVLAIGSFTSTPSISAAPVFASAKIPQIAPTATHPRYTAQSNYQFGSSNLEQIVAGHNARVLVDELHAKRIVVVYNQDDWGLLASKTTGEAIAAKGSQVILSEAVIPGSKDFRPLVSKIKALNPDAVYFGIHYAEAAILVQQLHQASVAVPIVAAETLTTPKFLELAGKDADGIRIVSTFLASNPANADFTKAFQARYSREPDRLAALSYDSISLGINAIKAVLDAGKPLTGAAVRDALEAAAPFKGVTGTTKFQKGTVDKDTLLLLLIKTAANTATLSSPIPIGGILDKTVSTVKNNSFRVQLDYNTSWGEHTLSAIGGAEIRNTVTKSDAYRVYGYNGNVLTSVAVDNTTLFPTRFSSSQTIPNGINFSEIENRYVSFYANAGYNYKDRYQLTASARRDASNIFGVATNDKWNPFWSVGGAWAISKEPFYKLGIINYLKLRATIGISGIADQSRSAVTVIQYQGQDAQTGLQYASIDQYANPDLRWEKIVTKNIGLDFALSNGILSGSVDYYRKQGRDLFGPAPVDYTIGQQSNVVTKNMANSLSKGLEIQLRSTNIRSRYIQWSTDWIFSYNRSITTAYYWPSIDYYTPTSGVTISPRVGYDMFAISAYKWGGLNPENGNPRGYVDGLLSEDYGTIVQSAKEVSILVYKGSSIPVYSGTVGNTITAKGLTLTVYLQYKLGYYLRKPSLSYSQLFDYGIGNADYAKRWQHMGDEARTNVPSMLYPNISYRDDFYQLSEATVIKGDQLRLQFINLDYSLPGSLSLKKMFKDIHLYCNASNLGIIWKANNAGIDPDYPGTIPTPVMLTFGIKTNLK
ncbi:MAG: TonB-dependent receptor [Arachidicoccus sp.]|nr:TonB-dependent receptor [Arachidicoccus sp.]